MIITFKYGAKNQDVQQQGPIWAWSTSTEWPTSSIGTASRDYSTITLWEAAIGVTAGGAGDDVVGECYNDSVFDEGFTLNNTTPNSIKLTVASGEEHDGTAGTGARVVCTGDYTFAATSTVTTTIEKLEVDYNGQEGVGYGFLSGSEHYAIANRLLVHDVAKPTWIRQFRFIPSVSNTIVYNIDCTTTYGAGVFAIEANGGVNGYGNGTRYNCTVWNTSASNNPSPFPIGIHANEKAIIKNCISINTGTNADEDIFFHVTAAAASDYNMSSGDQTNWTSGGGGANSITGVSDSTQFVSTVNGSEDLHLKAGSDAISVGSDLGTAEDVNLDINGLDRDASTSIVWDMGAHQYKVTTSIGTTARDYSTITLWEAALSGAAGGVGSAAVGECYNDSTFTEAVNISDSGPASILVTVPAAERHDGTEGTGATNIAPSISVAFSVSDNCPTTLEWIECSAPGSNAYNPAINISSGSTLRILQNMLIYDSAGPSYSPTYAILCHYAATLVQNVIIHDCGYGINSLDAHSNFFNVTIVKTTASYGFKYTDYIDVSIKNCIVMDNSSNTEFSPHTYYGDVAASNNMTSDTSAIGTDSLVSKASLDQFVSNVSGSPDLHLKSGADAIGAGTDLGAFAPHFHVPRIPGTAEDINIDINGLDRDAATSIVWDMGAHQYRVTTSIGTTARDYSTITLWEAAIGGTAGGTGSDVVGEMYNDSAFDEGFDISDTTPDAIKLTVASGEEHDGTAGTGARIVCTGAYTFVRTDEWKVCTTTIEKLEVDHNGQRYGSGNGFLHSGCDIVTRILLHDLAHDSWIRQFQGVISLSNTIVYNTDCTTTWGAGTYGIELGSCYNNDVERSNCTVWNTSASNNASPFVVGISGGCTQGYTRAIKNCISINTGTNVDYDFSIVTNPATSADYNMSADSTATGSNSITGVSDSTQFVSTVNGSEDLHLKAGSDAIGMGADLGTTDGVNLDINSLDRDFSTSTVWDMGAHQYRVTTSIGTALGESTRDYSTITLWEAAIGGTAGGAENDVVGEMYNDSAFDEGFVISDTTPDSIKLTVASGEEHDGTAGTGVRIVCAGAYTFTTGGSTTTGVTTTIEKLEIDHNGQSYGNPGYYNTGFLSGSKTDKVTRILLHDLSHNAGIQQFQLVMSLSNTIVYNTHSVWPSTHVHALSFTTCYSYNVERHNCTVWNTTGHSSGTSVAGFSGYCTTGYSRSVKNCISINTGTNADYDFNSFGPGAGISADYNMSADSTAIGSNSITGVSDSTQFVSTLTGSEDLHLITGSDALRTGVDLGTTNGVNIDIDGRDRDSNDDTWDIGADQCESCKVGGVGILRTAGGALDSFSLGANGFGSNFSLE